MKPLKAQRGRKLLTWAKKIWRAALGHLKWQKTCHTEQLQVLQWQTYPGGPAARIYSLLHSCAVAFASSPPTSIIYRRAGTWTLHYLAFPDSVSLSTVINLWPHCLPASSIQYQVDFLARNIIQPSQSNGRGSTVIIAVHIAHTTTLAKYPFIQLTAHFCDEIVT